MNDASVYMFKETLPYFKEAPKFNVIRKQYLTKEGWKSLELPKGWRTVANASIQKCLERGFDKVLYISRDLHELIKAMARSHRFAQKGIFRPSINDFIKLFLEEPRFFTNIQRDWLALEKEASEVKDPRFKRITLEDWNNNTLRVYNELLDFFEFLKEPRPRIIPIKSKRNFECHSWSFEPKEFKTDDFLEVMRKNE